MFFYYNLISLLDALRKILFLRAIFSFIISFSCWLIILSHSERHEYAPTLNHPVSLQNILAHSKIKFSLVEICHVMVISIACFCTLQS